MELAKGLDYTSAIKSSSWGAFQVMGEFYANTFSSIDEFELSMNHSAGAQFNYFVSFLQANPRIIKAMKNKDWAKIARIYNGRDYKKNRYDEKLADNYKTLKENKDE